MYGKIWNNWDFPENPKSIFWFFFVFLGFFKPKTRQGPRPDLARSFGIIFSSKNRNPNMFVKQVHENRQKHVQKTVQKSWKAQLSRSPSKQGPLKPCPFERSRDELSGGGIKTSVRPNPTIVFSFWSFDFYANLRPSEKRSECSVEITTGKMRNVLCLRFGLRINWFLVSKAFPIFPVVILLYQCQAKGQMARPQMAELTQRSVESNLARKSIVRNAQESIRFQTYTRT